jgi:hypothetical protein
VTAHGGSIPVASADGETTFTVRLPREGRGNGKPAAA